MSFLSSVLGLGSAAAEPRDLTVAYLIVNSLWAHGFSSARVWKTILGIDNQINPRSDLDKLGSRAVLEGKLAQSQLDMLKRNEAAHANSMDHYPVFATALILAKVAGVSTTEINLTGLLYTVIRLAYFGNYVFSTTLHWAGLRALLWWASNIVCLRLMWQAGTLFNIKGN